MLMLPDTKILRPNEKPSFEYTQRYGLDWQNAKVRLEGCVAFWLFNEGSGNTVFDLSGNRNTGTEQVDSVWQSGKTGPARFFSGNDLILTENEVVSGYPFTIVALVNAGGSASFRTICNVAYDGAGNINYALQFTSNNKVGIFARTAAGQDTLEGSIVAVDTWYHVAALFESATSRKIYLNGIFDASSAVSIPFDSSVNNVGIGALTDNSRSSFMVGLIDHVYIYDRGLLPSEIQQLYREPFCQIWRPRTQTVVGWVAGGAPPAGIPILRRRRECA